MVKTTIENFEITEELLNTYIIKIINRVYKLLPMREEGEDWQKPLETTIEELTGLSHVLNTKKDLFLTIFCKLSGLFYLDDADDFQIFRRVIFECLSLLNQLKVGV